MSANVDCIQNRKVKVVLRFTDENLYVKYFSII